MSEKKYKKFSEFWIFYLSQHLNKKNRVLHYVGTFLVHLVMIYALLSSQYRLILSCFVLGYGFAWAGHYFIEKNRPATFSYVLFSLKSDFKMFYMALFNSKQLSADLEIAKKIIV